MDVDNFDYSQETDHFTSVSHDVSDSLLPWDMIPHAT